MSSVNTRFNPPRMAMGKGAPLTRGHVMNAAPAVFTDHNGPNVLGSYQHISTAVVMEQLEKLNFVVMEASQERAHGWQDAYGKHMLRMRHKDYVTPTPKVGEVVPEIVVLNSHNGSSKLHLMAGLWRFVCANGMMAGSNFKTVSIAHMGNELEDATARAAEEFGTTFIPNLQAEVDQMVATNLTLAQRVGLAETAIQLRWGENYRGVTTDMLLAAGRPSDAGDSAWLTFNRIQENVMQGGYHGVGSNRRVKRLENVTRVVELNRALWDAATALIN